VTSPVRSIRTGKVIGGGLQIGTDCGELGGGGPKGREEGEWVEGGVQWEPRVWDGGGVQWWRRWLVDWLAAGSVAMPGMG